MKGQAKDHSSLAGNDLRNVVGTQDEKPRTVLPGSNDEVTDAIVVTAKLLDHAERSLRRFDAETQTLRQRSKLLPR